MRGIPQGTVAGTTCVTCATSGDGHSKMEDPVVHDPSRRELRDAQRQTIVRRHGRYRGKSPGREAKANR